MVYPVPFKDRWAQRREETRLADDSSFSTSSLCGDPDSVQGRGMSTVVNMWSRNMWSPCRVSQGLTPGPSAGPKLRRCSQPLSEMVQDCTQPLHPPMYLNSSPNDLCCLKQCKHSRDHCYAGSTVQGRRTTHSLQTQCFKRMLPALLVRWTVWNLHLWRADRTKHGKLSERSSKTRSLKLFLLKLNNFSFPLVDTHENRHRRILKYIHVFF